MENVDTVYKRRRFTAYKGGHNGQPGWWVHLPYDDERILTIKTRIDSKDRTYSPTTNEWWFSETVIETAQQIIPALAAFIAQKPLFEL